MSCVDMNMKVRKDISESMEVVMKAADERSGDARVALLNSAKMTAGVAYLEDISSSMAVIADSLSYIIKEETQVRKEREEKWKNGETPSGSKSMYLRSMELHLQRAGITKEEWNVWVELRDKYLFGKKEIKE